LKTIAPAKNRGFFVGVGSGEQLKFNKTIQPRMDTDETQMGRKEDEPRKTKNARSAFFSFRVFNVFRGKNFPIRVSSVLIRG
jgi:hypothetical protein